MKEWKSFFLGMIVGLLAGFILFYSIGYRYEITRNRETRMLIKMDKLTGKSWMPMYYTNEQGDHTWFWSEIKNR
ncbi:hypothetical protein ACFL50_03850 [Candidatus Latescibacterota bacterium]